MVNPNHVRQRDIAERAGVHITTVSLALRDDPRLPETTRKRIQALAKEMGYSPDPMLSALTVYRNHVKRVHHQGTLAWVNPHTQKGERHSSFMPYRQGAVERCKELGYQLEEFYFSDLGGPRLSKVLQARNITGLLLPPQTNSHVHLDFDWEHFSSICFGFTLTEPRLHVISNAQYSSARTAVRALRENYGYRRIGFVTARESDERTDQNFSAGFLSEQRKFEPENRLPLLTLTCLSMESEVDEFSRWYDEHRPDCVMFLHETVPELMRRLKLDTKTCGQASLSLKNKNDQLAGIYQNDTIIGRKAVDFLIDMIHRNERGIPTDRFQFMIQGEWVDGKTLHVQKRAKKVSV
ncbi:LacI family DNA-binding transcriptional regulator [Rariglobus hedericola]|uniref:LacI family transcriptional regulator n=1 Tax=Rariglobus hedericola TaxID=2597822 RepID=A0A556QSN2_9BACT|nr:LacI family DNA-binding transcriptional regulator [Rariglobus hedericola]TSJ79657.1 LacI family transcriptional regulator [Rariglobus hedericola]